MKRNTTRNTTQSDGDEEFRSFEHEEQQTVEELINRAVEAAARGENIEQLLEVLQSSFPAKVKEAVRKKFAAALAKKGLRQPSTELADIPSRNTLSRIRTALAVSSRQMIERIMKLVRSRPDVAQIIQQAGKTLTANGVEATRVVSMSEAELGTMAPTAGVKAQPERGTARGA